MEAKFCDSTAFLIVLFLQQSKLTVFLATENSFGTSQRLLSPFSTASMIFSLLLVTKSAHVATGY